MATTSAPTIMTMTILELPGTHYRLRKPIVAEVEHDPAGFVISEQSTGVFYYDADLSRVITGFVKTFVEQFEFLDRNRKNLSPSLESELERFQSILETPTA